MDDKTLKNALNDIAQMHVHDGTVDLWDRIRAEIGGEEGDDSGTVVPFPLESAQMGTGSPTRRGFNGALLARATAGLIAFLLVTTAVYAFYQINQPTDAGLSDVALTVLSQAQTQGDVTVDLEWAYVDTNRVALRYTRQEGPGAPPFYGAQLRLEDGTVLQEAYAGSGGGGGGPDGSFSEASQSYDASVIPSGVEEVTLVLELRYGVPFAGDAVAPVQREVMTEGGDSPPQITPSLTFTASPTVVNGTPGALASPVAVMIYTVVPGDTLSEIALRFNVSMDEIRSANGLDNVGERKVLVVGQDLYIPITQSAPTPLPPTAEPPASVTAMPVPPQASSTPASTITPAITPTANPFPLANPNADFNAEPLVFTFTFTLPVVQPAEVTLMPETVTTNTLTAALRDIAITPSLVLMQVCIQSPDTAQMWSAHVTLDTGSTQFTQQIPPGFASEQGENALFCAPLSITAPYDGNRADWTVTIDYLRSQPEATEANRQTYIDIIRESGFPDAELMGPGFALAMPGSGSGDFETEVQAQQAAIDAAMAAITTRVDGPWIFTLSLE